MDAISIITISDIGAQDATIAHDRENEKEKEKKNGKWKQKQATTAFGRRITTTEVNKFKTKLFSTGCVYDVNICDFFLPSNTIVVLTMKSKTDGKQWHLAFEI